MRWEVIWIERVHEADVGRSFDLGGQLRLIVFN